MSRTSTPRDLDTTQLRVAVAALLGEGHRVALVAGHEDDDCLRVVYVLVRAADDARAELAIRVPKDAPVVPSLADLDYGIGRFARELHDLYGITPEGHPLPARLVRHADDDAQGRAEHHPQRRPGRHLDGRRRLDV